ncbi:MAG TPA: tetratricopeptide repeat protein [Pedobacter sp.]|jgi:signal transduction histidine kinase
MIFKIQALLIIIIFPLILIAKGEDQAIIKADSLYRAANYKACIAILDNRLRKAKAQNEKLLQITLYNSLGKAYSQLGKPVEALKNYHAALKLADINKDQAKSGKILKNIGALYEEQKNFEQALSYYDKAQNIAVETQDTSLFADCLNNRGIIFEQQFKYDKALDVYKKALAIYQKTATEDRIALTLNNIGIVYKYLKQYQRAIDYYSSSLQYSKKLGDRFFVAANTTNIGNVYAMMHNYPKAIEYHKSGLKLALEINSPNIIVEAYASLADDYAGLGRYQEAYSFKEKFISANTDYINLESSKKLSEMQSLYETEKKEQQIFTLKQQQKINSLNISQQKLFNKNKNYLIVFILVISFSVIAVGYLYTKKQRSAQLLKNELAINEAENNERTRIAKDIHDDIGSGLSKINLMAQLANSRMQSTGVEATEINNISQISTDLVENMRDLIWVLNPENSTLDNLVARIREYCSDYLEGLTVLSEFDIQDDVPQIKISQPVQRNIFLTIKEALHNCIKHADCDKISVSLLVKEGLLNIAITDSGKGFDIKALKRNGNGLRNMQYRLESIGGDCFINSILGKGTTIQIEILLNQSEIPAVYTT